MKRVIILILMILFLIVPCLAQWDNTEPGDSTAWNDAAGLVRNNNDAIEAILGQTTMDGALSFADHTADVNGFNIQSKRPWRNVVAFGAVGDGSTDDKDAIRLAVADCNAGDVLYFPPGLTFKITEGITVNIGITIWGYGATLLMDGSSARSNNLPTISSAFDAQILVWNGSEAQNIMDFSSGEPVVEAAAKVAGFSCYGLTFNNTSGLGVSTLDALAVMLAMEGVERAIVKDCHFEFGGGNAGMIHCNGKYIFITDNTFINNEGDCIAGHFNTSLITNNTMTDVDFGFEGALWNSAITNNKIKAGTTQNTVGIWVTNGGNEVDILGDVIGNIIDGYFTDKILVTESGVPATPSNFKRLNISNNTLTGRIFSTGGNGINLETAAGRYTIANNSFDDRGTTGNCGSFITVTGADTDGKYVIRGNTGHVTTSFVSDLVEVPGIDIHCLIADNTSIHDTGEVFRDASTSGAIFRDAIRIGTFKSDLKILENNHINQTNRYVDVSTDTVILIGGLEEFYFNSAIKSVTDIYANGFFVVHNLGANTVTLTDDDAKIENTGDADVVLTTGDSAGYIAVGTTGKVKQVF